MSITLHHLAILTINIWIQFIINIIIGFIINFIIGFIINGICIQFIINLQLL